MERTYRYSTFMRDEILQTRIYRVCKLNLIVNKEEQRGRRGNEFSEFLIRYVFEIARVRIN